MGDEPDSREQFFVEPSLRCPAPFLTASGRSRDPNHPGPAALPHGTIRATRRGAVLNSRRVEVAICPRHESVDPVASSGLKSAGAGFPGLRKNNPAETCSGRGGAGLPVDVVLTEQVMASRYHFPASSQATARARLRGRAGRRPCCSWGPVVENGADKG